MRPQRSNSLTFWTVAALLAVTSAVLAQGTAPAVPPLPATPAAAPAPATPPSPITGIRNKLSAGDLLSAESILEVHRARSGEDSTYLAALSWLARGALLTGDTAKARRYAADVRLRCAERLAKGGDLAKDHGLELALGAAIETQAQLIERARGARAAALFLRAELKGIPAPVALRSRLYKRLNMLAMPGTPAPELEIEDFIGQRPSTLASLRGQPVLIFVWAEGCGDCRAQEASLARAKARFADRGLRLVALTRYYDEPSDRMVEKARVDSVWKTHYADVGRADVVLSTASMERYGGSSTPTFVFVDRSGIVRGYTPTRLTEAELDRRLASLVR